MSRNDLKKSVVFSSSKKRHLIEVAIQEDSRDSGKTQSAEIETNLMESLYPSKHPYLLERIQSLYSERVDIPSCLRGIFWRIPSDPGFMVRENIELVKITRDLMADKVMDWDCYAETDKIKSATPFRFLTRTLESIIDSLTGELDIIDAKLCVNRVIYDSKICEQNNKVCDLIYSSELHQKSKIENAINAITQLIEDLEGNFLSSFNFEISFFSWLLDVWEYLYSCVSVYTLLGDLQNCLKLEYCDPAMRAKIRRAALVADKAWK